MQPHLGHEVDPAAGSIINGVQLLEQDAGVGQGEVAIEKAVQKVIVGDVQDLWVLVEVSSELQQCGRDGRGRLEYPLPFSTAPVVNTDGTNTSQCSFWGWQDSTQTEQGDSLVLAKAGWAPRSTSHTEAEGA